MKYATEQGTQDERKKQIFCLLVDFTCVYNSWFNNLQEEFGCTYISFEKRSGQAVQITKDVDYILQGYSLANPFTSCCKHFRNMTVEEQLNAI